MFWQVVNLVDDEHVVKYQKLGFKFLFAIIDDIIYMEAEDLVKLPKPHGGVKPIGPARFFVLQWILLCIL